MPRIVREAMLTRHEQQRCGGKDQGEFTHDIIICMLTISIDMLRIPPIPPDVMSIQAALMDAV